MPNAPQRVSSPTLTVSDNAIMCRCNRSLAVLSGLVAGLTVAMLLSESRCLDRGGRLSDVAWACELPLEGSTSIWSLMNPAALCLVVFAVAIPVYFIVDAIGNRWLGRYRGHPPGNYERRHATAGESVPKEE